MNTSPYLVALAYCPDSHPSTPWSVCGIARDRESLRSAFFHPVKGAPGALHTIFNLSSTDDADATREEAELALVAAQLRGDIP